MLACTCTAANGWDNPWQRGCRSIWLNNLWSSPTASGPWLKQQSPTSRAANDCTLDVGSSAATAPGTPVSSVPLYPKACPADTRGERCFGCHVNLHVLQEHVPPTALYHRAIEPHQIAEHTHIAGPPCPAASIAGAPHRTDVMLALRCHRRRCCCQDLLPGHAQPTMPARQMRIPCGHHVADSATALALAVLNNLLSCLMCVGRVDTVGHLPQQSTP